MAIRVAPGAEDLACDLAGQFLLQIVGSSDPDGATAALQDARADVLALIPAGTPGRQTLSNAVLGPAGPLLRVSGLDIGERLLAKVPGLVTARLARAGVDEATVEVVESSYAFDHLDGATGAAVLRLFPEPAGEAGRLPAPWIDIAADWVLGGLAAGDLVSVRLLGSPFEAPAADAPGILHQAARARTWCDLVQGDPRGRLRTASLSFGRTPHLALAAGGPGCDTAALLARFELLCEVARDLGADVAYCSVDLEPTFEDIGVGFSGDGWHDNGGAPPNEVAGQVVDVCVPDAFPFQILGPGHVERLNRRGERKPIGTALADGRVEVVLGDAVDWLPQYDTRDEQLERGWKVLLPLLISDAELTELTAARQPSGKAKPGVVPGVAASGPDLADIVLDPLPHPRRGLHLTLLELVSWLAHEPHSDAPRSVSPVVAAYARWLAPALDAERRQQLVPRAPQLVGTRGRSLVGTAWRLLPDAEDERAWRAADWLLRVQSPAWLAGAGLEPSARKLAAVGPKRDRRHITRASTLAGAALDMLSAAVRDDDDTAGELAWRAWERAAEASGWVAASEAAVVGVPSLLADAVEQRVIELTRTHHEARASVLAEARAAAFEAASQAAWEAGWSAARSTVDESALVPFATAVERARRAAVTRVSSDRDALEQALEVAMTAARAAIAAVVADGGDPGAAWVAAMDDAAESDGGEAWRTVQELTAGILGPSAWEAGMTAAATAAARVAAAAPSLIERAVTVTVARETAGAAARSIARAAATTAFAAGATSDEAATAATEALAPTTEALTDAAIDLLDTLIAVR